jgi:hypothetical protein
MFSKTFALFGMASAASAHIIMTNPVPLGNPNSSPLDPSGSDFPCKGSVSGGSGDNTYEQGSTQQLAFKGSAVHGGGSCQVSITTDLNPTQDSEWKVIKSIEGGCPAQDATGNLGSNPDLETPYKYNFKIPEELATGEYVLAWTWFNKVGNREMYMNCAALTVTGSGGDDGFYDTLPDMFVANIGNGCSVGEGTDVEFPNPGNDLEQLNGATSAFAAPTGDCAGNPGSPGPAPTNAPSPTSSAAPLPTQEVPGGVFQPIPDEPSTTAPATPTEEPAAPAPEEPSAPAPEEPATPAPENPSGGHEAGSACTSEGAWNCVGGNSFQRCGSGVWTGVQPLASGMTCNDGEASELKVNVVNNERAISARAVPLRV